MTIAQKNMVYGELLALANNDDNDDIPNIIKSFALLLFFILIPPSVLLNVLKFICFYRENWYFPNYHEYIGKTS